MALSIWLHDKRIGAVYIIAALLVGVARIWGNVHYPVDIVGGAILGAAVAFLIEKVHLKRFIP
jgi:membrane-associated phospholipid phosphatase